MSCKSSRSKAQEPKELAGTCYVPPLDCLERSRGGQKDTGNFKRAAEHMRSRVDILLHEGAVLLVYTQDNCQLKAVRDFLGERELLATELDPSGVQFAASFDL